jgi:glycosyltransferase involved in cell wall biosynthesis
MSVSVITACKNRGKALSISISSWIQFDKIKEIIAVDWSSDEPIDHLIKYDERIKIITVNGEKYFNQPQPLNLAASIATGDYILKLDSDTILNPYYNFFESHSIDKTSFLTGFYDKKEIGTNCYYDGLWGTLYLTKKNFFGVGGYNENMGDYGAWEDDEIVERLMILGLTHKKINLKSNTLLSIPHPSKKRVENFKAYSENKKIELNIRKYLKEKYNTDSENVVHKLILEKHNRINWKKYQTNEDSKYYIDPAIKWNITQIDFQHYVAEKIPNK